MEDIYPGCVKEFYEAGAEYRNLILRIKNSYTTTCTNIHTQSPHEETHTSIHGQSYTHARKETDTNTNSNTRQRTRTRPAK